MYDFEFRRATSLEQAGEWMRSGAEVKLLAGGQTLLPTLKLRLAAPKELVDIGAIRGLSMIERSGGSLVTERPGLGGGGALVLRGGTLTIGALARHNDVAESSEVSESIPALAALAGGIGDPAVRNRGTLGGSIANNDPAADYPAAVLALNAIVFTNRREIAADNFFTGLFETALAPDEIVTRVNFVVPTRAAYAKFRNKASRFALVGVFVAEHGGSVRVAVTGASESGVFRWTAAEDALSERFDPDALRDLKADAAGLVSDIHAAADYRAHLIAIMTRRAVAAALG